MITWHEELDFDFSDPMINRTFTDDAIFFDIETTGFSPARTSLYLIGCATRKDNRLCLDQFFAESPDDQEEVLNRFLSLLKKYHTILTFNGIGFDLPYLKAKCKTFHILDPFASFHYVDLYKEAARMKFLLKLSSFKQKTIEQFLGIDRIDAYSGGELIEVYEAYQKNPSSEALALLRQHNYEDVLCMPKLLPLLSYRKFFEGNFSVVSLSADEYKSMDGTPCKELFFTLSAGYTVPAPVSLGCGDCYLSLNGSAAKLRVRLFDGVLKYFFASPKDYYYLPQEDIAIHKSAASGVDREHRVQATATNCYAKKHAIFLPQYEMLFSPTYRTQAKDKISYFELSEEFAASASLQHRYVKHLLQWMPKCGTTRFHEN